MAKIKRVYKCSNCGKEYLKPTGKCNICNNFGTIEEVILNENTAKSINGIDKAERLNMVNTSIDSRLITGIDEFDRVFGGGIVNDSINILTAPPGTGKSTLLLQVCNTLAKQGLKVLYVSGEESKSQIKQRGDRILQNNIDDNILILTDNNIENIKKSIIDNSIDFIIIDSIQRIISSDSTSKEGSIIQTNIVANILTDICKNGDKKRACILVSQMTKDDEIRGSRELEHLVDGVFRLEAEEFSELRVLRGTKNRFGNIDCGLFEMESDGMTPLENPSQYFTTNKDDGAIGNSLTVIKEGTRPILLEIESAVTKSYTPFPTRISECLRKDQLSILVAILEQNNITLYDNNVIVKVTGGLKIKEPSVNLALLMAIASSKKKKPLSNKTIFLGEVGLAGDLKKVNSLDIRIKEADRMGFSEIIIPNQTIKIDTNSLNIKITKFKKLKEVINYCLS